MARNAKGVIGTQYNGVRATAEFLSDYTVTRMFGYEQKEKHVRMVSTVCDRCGAKKDVERTYFMQGVVKCKCGRPEKKKMLVSVKKIKDIEDKVLSLDLDEDAKVEFTKMFQSLRVQAVSNEL